MDPSIQDIAQRIRALREDLGFTMQEMAKATNRTVAEYAAQEAGTQDLSFTFLSRCAQTFGVDVVEIITGEGPHLTGYSVVRDGEGLSIKRRAGFEYLHKAPTFRRRFCDPFVVTAPYCEEEQDKPIHLSRHAGQELDYILSGHLLFRYEDHVEEVGPGDTIYYNSDRGHGMIATGGEPCTFVAITIKSRDEELY